LNLTISLTLLSSVFSSQAKVTLTDWSAAATN